jgi:hypothetical protein
MSIARRDTITNTKKPRADLAFLEACLGASYEGACRGDRPCPSAVAYLYRCNNHNRSNRSTVKIATAAETITWTGKETTTWTGKDGGS